MRLTVMIQRRWWSAVTKCPRSGRKVNTPGWRRLTSLPRWKDTKIQKMKISRGADLVWFAQKGPGNIEELWRSMLYKLSIHILVIEWGIYFNSPPQLMLHWWDLGWYPPTVICDGSRKWGEQVLWWICQQFAFACWLPLVWRLFGCRARGWNVVWAQNTCSSHWFVQRLPWRDRQHCLRKAAQVAVAIAVA